MRGGLGHNEGVQRGRWARGAWAMLLGGMACVAGCAAGRGGPPREQGPFLRPDLVEVRSVQPGLRLDVRYATSNNFLGRPVYARPIVLLQRPAAMALGRAHERLAPAGFGIVVFDGYRPWSVTRLFWESVPPSQREYVADPSKGSRHNRGCAVDCSLYDLHTGALVPMPSVYDEPTVRAHAGFAGGTAAERHARDLLRAAMESEGFTVLPNEWWHFDHQHWRRYRLMNTPLGRVRPRPRGTAQAGHGTSPALQRGGGGW